MALMSLRSRSHVKAPMVKYIYIYHIYHIHYNIKVNIPSKLNNIRKTRQKYNYIQNIFKKTHKRTYKSSM